MLAAVLFALAVPNAQLARDPYVIFDRARTFWSSQHYPSVVNYTVHVTATDADSNNEQRHYHEYWNAQSNTVVVQPPESDEQLARPYKPSGWFNLMGLDVGGPGTGVKGDLFDVPALAPNYSFGIAPYMPTTTGAESPAEIVAEIRRTYHDPAPQKIAQLEKQYGLKTIAVVVSTKREYTITLVGIETIEGHRDYHLAMQPLSDPQKYRLRDVWIATATFATDQLNLAGNFSDKSTEGISWLVNLRQFDGATYIAKESAQAPLDGYRGRMYDTFSVSFEDLGTGKSPFWMGGASGGGSLSEPPLGPTGPGGA